MTTSLLATLIFCSLIILSMGAVIYLFNRVKTPNRFYYDQRFPRLRGERCWPLTFLRPGMGHAATDLRAGETFEELMEAGKHRRSKYRRAK